MAGSAARRLRRTAATTAASMAALAAASSPIHAGDADSGDHPAGRTDTDTWRPAAAAVTTGAEGGRRTAECGRATADAEREEAERREEAARREEDGERRPERGGRKDIGRPSTRKRLRARLCQRRWEGRETRERGGVRTKAGVCARGVRECERHQGK